MRVFGGDCERVAVASVLDPGSNRLGSDALAARDGPRALVQIWVLDNHSNRLTGGEALR